MKKNLILAVLILPLMMVVGFKQQQRPRLALGVVGPIEWDSAIYASGYRMIGESVSKILSPALTEQRFRNNIAKIKQARCRVYMCNILFPPEMKIAGPNVNEQRVLAYADSVFLRADQADIRLIVLGSGTARRIPDGYDAQKAQADFTLLCGKLARLAQKHNIMLALESLEKAETNFLLTLKSTAQVVRAVNNPHFKLNVDIYHMSRENESPQSIIDAADLLIHCEIAEKENRTFPGVKGDDFKPYLRALKKANYKGPIFIEPGGKYTTADMQTGFKYLNRELDEVYAEM
ncbi:MAG TPA: TIM barrel protein [Mucilaginibacter sp.]|jgi:sugar phosphate isomerase/epimerase|nr:TIM barrel protein [Mucilaginibacter sp.]